MVRMRCIGCCALPLPLAGEGWGGGTWRICEPIARKQGEVGHPGELIVIAARMQPILYPACTKLAVRR
jgi:hypothetical protein